MPSFNYDLAAKALVDAIFNGDAATAKEYSVTERSIRNWRKRLHEDEHFSSFFREKLHEREIESGWAKRLPIAIEASINFLERAAKESDHKNPEAIEAITAALGRLSEIAITREVLDARLTQQRRQTDQAN